MDVIEWYQDQSLRQSIENSLSAPTHKDAIRGIVQEVFRNKELIRQLMASQRREEIEQIFLKSVRSYLCEMLRARMPDLEFSPADIETAICFYSCGLVGLMLTALQQKQMDVEIMTNQMCRLLTGEISVPFARKEMREQALNE